MARPGKVALLPSCQGAGEHRSVVAVALTLLDGETTFAVLDRRNEPLISYCTLIAGSRMVEAAQADYLFLSGDGCPAQLHDVRRGNLLFPERGATLVCRVRAIYPDNSGDGVTLALQGPGAPGKRTFRAEGISREFLDELCRLNAEYPLGVETILVSSRGEIACLPRSVRFTWQ
jgi:alpha-D-ribose 1-methylphosphonate 5-triphosphate synthase subunit PhnH